MVYDVVNGVHFLLQFVQPEDEGTKPYEDTYVYEASPVEESREEYYSSESPVYENSESYEDL